MKQDEDLIKKQINELKKDIKDKEDMLRSLSLEDEYLNQDDENLNDEIADKTDK